MTWTLVLTLFFTNREPRIITIPSWLTETHCYVAGGILEEEHSKDKNMTWATISCKQEGNS